MKGDAGKAGILPVSEPTETVSGSDMVISGEVATDEDGRRATFHGEPETTGLSQLSDIVTLETAPHHIIGSNVNIGEHLGELEQASCTPDLCCTASTKNNPSLRLGILSRH